MDQATYEQNTVIVSRRDTDTTPLLKSLSLAASAADSIATEQPVNAHPINAQPTQSRPPGDDNSTWCQEVRTLVRYAAPLALTFVLQYSIDVSSIVAAGRLGKVELGAVSLANMSAAITCFAAFQGLVTSLDTLCCQAYGSGELQLVGLYCQRMMLLLLGVSIPIAALWAFSEIIMLNLVQNAESGRLCSLYLKIMIFAIPGFAAFEVGKRFLQAQGLFRVTTYALLVGAPTNAILMWLLIWKLNLGFIGAPISVAITRTLLPVLLFLYVIFVDGSQCWGGFSKRAFLNLKAIIRLAVPGMIMVEAEWLAFEVMTIVSTRFGVEYLAAQSIMITFTTLSYQIPFSLSIAASSRVAFLIGAGHTNSAKVAARVAVAASTTSAFLNFVVFIVFRVQLPPIFTDNKEVAAIVTSALPIAAISILFDGVAVAAHGLLRGIGKQYVGGLANLLSYYGVSIPLSLGLGVGLNWKIEGLWMGCITGLVVVSIIEYAFLLTADWRQAVAEATARTAIY